MHRRAPLEVLVHEARSRGMRSPTQEARREGKSRARIVSIDLVDPASAKGVGLRCTKAQLDALGEAEETGVRTGPRARRRPATSSCWR